MKCPLCGEPVSQDDLYCGNCGYNLLQDRDDWDEEDVSLSGSAAPSVEVPDDSTVLPPQESPDLELPADTAAPRGDRDTNWRAIVVVAAILVFLACCCCIGFFYMLSLSGST